MQKFYFLVVLLVATTWYVPAHADPILLPVQGRLLNSGGNPVSGIENITFSIYPTATGGTAVYVEAQSVGFTAGGDFVAYVGEVVPLQADVFAGAPDLWLGIAVQGDAEMQPRFRLGSAATTAYAQMCGDAMTVGGLSGAELVLHVVDGNGAVVGPMADFSNLYLPDVDRLVEVSVISRWEVVIVEGDSNVVYESADCTGTPFAGTSLSYFELDAILMFGQLWAPSNVATNMAVGSYPTADGGCAPHPFAGVIISAYPMVDITPPNWPPVAPLTLVFPQP